jgi:hypothetical protein
MILKSLLNRKNKKHPKTKGKKLALAS